MRDLVLHIGLPKTATTALRQSLYRSLPGYLGAYATTPGAQELSRRLQTIFARFTLDRSPSGASETRRSLIEWDHSVGHLDSDGPTVLVNHRLSEWAFDTDLKRPIRVISDEVLTNRALAGPPPLIEFLNALREVVDRRLRLRTIVSLRNQADWLASLYAQSARTLEKPGMTDFESKVSQIITRDDPRVDYRTLVTGLQQSVGSDNTLVLLYEDGASANARTVAEFLGLLSGEQLQVPYINVRNVGEDGWQLFHDRTIKLRLLRKLSRNSSLPIEVAHWSMRTVKALERQIESARTPLRSLRWGQTLTLRADVREAITRHCHGPNVLLGSAINRNLSAYGYLKVEAP